MQGIVDTLTGIADWITEKISGITGGATDIFGGIAGTALKFLSGGDFILTPNGQMIETDPRDYLVATTNPKSLMGGGSKIFNISITINNPQMRDTADANRLAEDIFKRLEFNLKRGGNYNGVSP